MHTVLRRIRGTLMTMGLWAFLWALLGPAVGWGVLWIIMGRGRIVAIGFGVGHHPLTPTTMFASAGFLSGAISGLGFAISLMIAQRGRDVSKLSMLPFVLIGAVPAAALLGYGFRSLPFAAIGAVIGGTAAAAMLSIARRGSGDSASESLI